MRDNIVTYCEDVTERSQLTLVLLLSLLGIRRDKYYDWKMRYGLANQDNYKQPKSHWLPIEEREAIINYAKNFYTQNSSYCRESYRRLAYMMIDADICTCSPATVYNILHEEDLLNRWHGKKNVTKGSGFHQPTKPHEHWHIDIKYVNFRGTFLYFISILDGYSRYILHHELRLNMTELDVSITLQRAKEKFPDAKVRIISDNGKQFIAKEFQNLLNTSGFTHVKTSPMYPQSNGKIERFHRTLSEECIRTNSLIDLDDARSQFIDYIEFYNNERLHSALNYLPPRDYLEGTYEEKLNKRKDKIRQGYEQRKLHNKKNAA